MIRYAITDRHFSGGDESTQRLNLFALVQRWAAEPVDFIQLREKDLPAADLEQLVRAITATFQATGSKTKLLLNSRADIAVAAGADGVHLTAAPGQPAPAQIRSLFARAGRPAPIVSISCHTLEEVIRARNAAVDLILFGPVFGKSVSGVEVTPAAGLDLLRQACEAAGESPVLALGGVTAERVQSCLEVGAKGIAAIRLFADVTHGKMQKS